MDEFLEAMEHWLEVTADLNEKKKKCEYDADYFLAFEYNMKRRASERAKKALEAILNERPSCQCGVKS